MYIYISTFIAASILVSISISMSVSISIYILPGRCCYDEGSFYTLERPVTVVLRDVAGIYMNRSYIKEAVSFLHVASIATNCDVLRP